MTAITKKQPEKETSNAKNIHMALCAVQAEVKNPPKERNAKVKSRRTGAEFEYKYADISDVLETVLPVLSKHGIAISQKTKIDEGSVTLRTVLTHGESGTSIECDYPVCKVDNNHQEMGGALTYARRYALCTMVGVAPAEDLDGADAAKSGNGNMEKMSAAQAKKEINWDQIVSTIRATKSTEMLDKRREEAIAKEGYWPSSFISSALEEIQTRREELEYEARASEAKDDPSVIADLLEECRTVSGVERLHMTLKQVGVDLSNVEDEFDLRKEELSS